jgi:hypothetical protein
MKIQVLHDEKGKILSFSMVKDGVKDGLTLVPKPKQSIKVIDFPMAKEEKMSSEEEFRALVEKIGKHKVDIKSKKGKLVLK